MDQQMRGLTTPATPNEFIQRTMLVSHFTIIIADPTSAFANEVRFLVQRCASCYVLMAPIWAIVAVCAG